MNIEVIGLGFKLTDHGGYVLDLRDEDPKFVGLIMESPTGKGYTVCPYVRKSLKFSTAIPKNMRSPRKVQEWVKEHAVAWKPRNYTILNPVIRFIDWIPRCVCTLRNTQFKIIVLQFFIAFLAGFYPTENEILSILVKVGGTTIAIWAIFNTFQYCKDPFNRQ